jgi:hypothetical protein
MPYNPLSKIVTSPVSIGDVQQAMSDYRYNDIGNLCTSDKINHMAKYHPLKPTGFPRHHLTPYEREQRNYGWSDTYVEGVALLLDPWPQSLSNLPQFELKRKDDSRPWIYYNLWDFAEDAQYGYYHSAPKQILYSCEGTALANDVVNPASGGARFMILQDLVDSAISGKLLSWNNRTLVDSGLHRVISADQKECSIYPEDLVFHSPGTGFDHYIYDHNSYLCVVIQDLNRIGEQGSYQILDAARALGYPSTLEEAQEMLFVDLSNAFVQYSNHNYVAILCVHARDQILQGNEITYKDIFIPIQGSAEHPTVIPFTDILPREGYDYQAVGFSPVMTPPAPGLIVVFRSNLTVTSRDSDVYIRMRVKNHTGVPSGADAETSLKWKLNIRFRGNLYDKNGYNYYVDETYSLPFEDYYPTTQQFLSLPDGQLVPVTFKIPSDRKLFRTRTITDPLDPRYGTRIVPVSGTLNVISCEVTFNGAVLNEMPDQPSMSVTVNDPSNENEGHV